MPAAVLRSDSQVAMALYPLTFSPALLKRVRLRTVQHQSHCSTGADEAVIRCTLSCS